MSDGITETGKSLILEKTTGYHCSVEFLDIESVLTDISIAGGSRHPKTIYVKLFLQNSIPVEKILYLDSDTVIMGNLEELWERDMKQELIAGVQMPYSEKLKTAMNINRGNTYLCDGIVLLNLALWRDEDIESKCRNYIKKYHGLPPMQSEGTLNYVCQGRIGVLSPAYNLMPSMIMYSADQIKKLFKVPEYYTEQELAEARDKPIIIHFINELFNRPWFEPSDHPYKQFYREERASLFGTKNYETKNLSQNTRLTRTLKRILPFPVFAALYHIKHKDI